ncbi:hypothetical protein [Glaciecola petra]|uniref:PEP-CTERM sorting domain-containing protein n=1 Tax=Glaciecola petra TaxID=3075602 RepID=A0ABU2ZS64_9ALTE|nr:hypothetical protein [Aestuariibacter sp. P117]MDT0595467.1 hypothetical protein [Aestuariibacter sp. P117]
MLARLLCTGIVLLFSSFVSHATIIEVSQGGNVLGTIRAFNGTESALQNWNRNANPNIGPGGIARASQLFFYSNPIDGVTFNFLSDRANSNSSGGLSLLATVDSTGDPFALYGDDGFHEFYETTNNDVFKGNWNWISCCTDGGIIGGLNGKWSIDVEITRITNVNQFLIQGLDNTIVYDQSQSVSFRNVSTPASITLVIFALGLLAYKGLKR